MGIFDKKYDLEKDRLRIEFDLNQCKYVIYYGQQLLSYDSLNRKTKKVLDEKNVKLYNDSNLYQSEMERAKRLERFKKLRSMGFTPGGFQCGGQGGTVSQNVGEYFNKLLQEENVLLGIHRIGADDSIITDVLTNGLIMSGHSGSGASSYVNLGDNVGFWEDNSIAINELMYTDKYKNSKGSFLIRIPDSDLKGNIYIQYSDGTIRLNPKYIVGYVPVEPNHHISRLIQIQKQNLYTTSQQASYSNLYEQPSVEYETGVRTR